MASSGVLVCLRFDWKPSQRYPKRRILSSNFRYLFKKIKWLGVYGQELLKRLFPVSVHHTGGSNERGTDIEIIIQNPFKENEDRDWIIPIQVKDYDGEVDINVASQLKDAFESRSETNQVIAVVLLASNAEASKDLIKRMDELTKEKGVPFIFGGHELFMRLLARGYLRRS